MWGRCCVLGRLKKCEKFIAWCKKCSPLAKVEKVDIEWRSKIEKIDTFEIQ